MSTVRDLLGQLTDIGATLKVIGGQLVVRAGATAVPSRLLAQLRHDKPLVLSILADASRADIPPDASAWRGYYEERAGVREYDAGYDRAEAERLAWSDMLLAWHMMCGGRPARSRCAGCDEPVGTDALVLPDGARVHFVGIDCLTRYGDRWRGRAEQALVHIGLVRPGTADAD